MYEQTSSTFTVTFLPGEHGTFEAQITPGLQIGDTTPDAPALSGDEGWRFTGWQPARSPVVVGNATYTAIWQRISYTVTFVDHNGILLESQQVAHGWFAKAPSAPARTGWRFVGWDRSLGPVASDMTLKAVYTPLGTYTVSFLPGAYGTFVAQITTGLHTGDTTPQPPIPSGVSGWRFTGWTPELSPLVTGNVEYVANWESTITPTDPKPQEPLPPTQVPPIIINTPSTSQAAPDRYITVTTPSTSSTTTDTSQDETNGADDSKTTGQQDDQITTLPDDKTPLVDGTDTTQDDKAQKTLLIVLISLLVFLLLVAGGLLYQWRTRHRME
jgi:hypothetical protein